MAISGREFGVHVLWMRCSQSVVIKIEPNPRDPPSRLAIALTIPADWNSVWLDFGFEAPLYREFVLRRRLTASLASIAEVFWSSAALDKTHRYFEICREMALRRCDWFHTM